MGGRERGNVGGGRSEGGEGRTEGGGEGGVEGMKDRRERRRRESTDGRSAVMYCTVLYCEADAIPNELPRQLNQLG